MLQVNANGLRKWRRWCVKKTTWASFDKMILKILRSWSCGGGPASSAKKAVKRTSKVLKVAGTFQLAVSCSMSFASLVILDLSSVADQG